MYDYIIEKPELNEETLAHYGVKGMKWRKKRSRGQVLGKNKKSFARKDQGYPKAEGNHDDYTLKVNGKDAAKARIYKNEGTSGTTEHHYGSLKVDEPNYINGILAGRERAKKKKK